MQTRPADLTSFLANNIHIFGIRIDKYKCQKEIVYLPKGCLQFNIHQSISRWKLCISKSVQTGKEISSTFSSVKWISIGRVGLWKKKKELCTQSLIPRKNNSHANEKNKPIYWWWIIQQRRAYIQFSIKQTTEQAMISI